MGRQFTVMGPVGGNKKKRKIEKKAEENALILGSSEEGCTKWWGVLSKTIAGNFPNFQFLCSCLHITVKNLSWYTIWNYVVTCNASFFLVIRFSYHHYMIYLFCMWPHAHIHKYVSSQFWMLIFSLLLIVLNESRQCNVSLLKSRT